MGSSTEQITKFPQEINGKKNKKENQKEPKV